MRWKRFAVAVNTGLSVLVAGCGSQDDSLPGSAAPADPSSQKLDDTVITTGEVLRGGRLADAIAAWDVSGLNTYRFETAIGLVGNWEGAEVTTGAIGLNPPGIDIAVAISIDLKKLHRYIVTPDGGRRAHFDDWTVLTEVEGVPGQEGQLATWLLEHLLGTGQPDIRNGRPVTAYRIENLEDFPLLNVGSWSHGQAAAEVWVDDQLGISVETRFEQELFKGSSETDSLVITWRMYDLDVPLAIELPPVTYPPLPSPAALQAQNRLDRAFDFAAEFLAATSQLPSNPSDLNLEGLVAIEEGVDPGQVGFLAGDGQLMLVAAADPGVWLCVSLHPTGQRTYGNAPSRESFLDPAIGCDNFGLQPDWHPG